MIVPDQELQKRFEEVVSKFQGQAELLKKSNELLASTRDRLLPRLISGTLSVENLDIPFPPAMAAELESGATAPAQA
jgi:type I restriction enzyme S subunit